MVSYRRQCDDGAITKNVIFLKVTKENDAPRTLSVILP